MCILFYVKIIYAHVFQCLTGCPVPQLVPDDRRCLKIWRLVAPVPPDVRYPRTSGKTIQSQTQRISGPHRKSGLIHPVPFYDPHRTSDAPWNIEYLASVWYFGLLAQWFSDCLPQIGLSDFNKGGVMTVACLRFALVFVVVARWSTFVVLLWWRWIDRKSTPSLHYYKMF